MQLVSGDIAANKYDAIIASTSIANALKPAAKVLRAMTPTAKRGTRVCGLSVAVLRLATPLNAYHSTY